MLQKKRTTVSLGGLHSSCGFEIDYQAAWGGDMHIRSVGGGDALDPGGGVGAQQTPVSYADGLTLLPAAVAEGDLALAPGMVVDILRQEAERRWRRVGTFRVVTLDGERAGVEAIARGFPRSRREGDEQPIGAGAP